MFFRVIVCQSICLSMFVITPTVMNKSLRKFYALANLRIDFVKKKLFFFCKASDHILGTKKKKKKKKKNSLIFKGHILNIFSITLTL